MRRRSTSVCRACWSPTRWERCWPIGSDGNSLGARPRAAAERAREVLEEEWGEDLIGSWNKHHWFALPTRIGDKIGRLIGGGEGNCVATDTTSINVFKALAAALRIQRQDHPERRVIVSERENFPTDLYMAEGLIEFLGEAVAGGYELRLVDSPGADVAAAEASLAEALGDDVAVVMLTQVNYRSGAMWPLDRVTRAAHDVGALVVWDLCHSAGAVPIDLLGADADFAVGCTYKYLNGGPGSPAFVWVAPRHQARAEQPLSGWWGHRRPFDMAVGYEAAPGAQRFLVGTQPILSMATMEAGIDIALSVDERLLREKSLALTSLFIRLVEQRCAAHPLTLITPRDEAGRGSHVSFRHPEGFAVMKALIGQGVIGDYREPEVLRFGFTPLYVGYADVWDAVETLRRVLDDEIWRAPEFQLRGAVT
ncbi:MAG: kynureninase [Actinobacteria bacterium]|nr:kynureninase [Actinomycetota bacterium]